MCTFQFHALLGNSYNWQYKFEVQMIKIIRYDIRKYFETWIDTNTFFFVKKFSSQLRVIFPCEQLILTALDDRKKYVLSIRHNLRVWH